MRTPVGSIIIALAILLLATSCRSRPRKTLKYRKKRGCDCPNWGMMNGLPIHGARTCDSPWTEAGC